MELLSAIEDNSIKVCFFDPQYRQILNKLSYGDEGKNRGKKRCELTQMSDETIEKFIKEIDRVLLPSGYLFLWVDKFILCQGIDNWLASTSLSIVDLITWNKLKIGMGYRTRRKSEYLIILQKKPIRAKSTWILHNIPDVWDEKVVKVHAHSKPIELQKQLILATTQENDYVLDPASGGYSVFEACRTINRNFIGCDIEFGA
ncbi:MAG: site-specific DNA-methyltransferase [Lachnospiraceae bacterium]|jgi:site-specific DNA-methyltransferase (adenine-specific)|nr:site-specific DNA-methyltransferase [Lachnospiraceae bacterium]